MNTELFDDIYEVTAKEYYDFFKGIKPGAIKNDSVIKEDAAQNITISNATGKPLCGKKVNSEGKTTFYIFNIPEEFESQEIKVYPKVILSEGWQVQKLFEYLAEKNEEIKKQ